jgi:2-keto-4-pentenoate hydratase
VNVEQGMAAQLVRRREILAQGAQPIGWKIGFNLAQIQQKLGIDRPLAGFLTTDGLLEDGASWSLGNDGEVIVESEVAVELGDDARTIVALLPALELADPPDLSIELEQILAGDIFHRAVAFGPRVETTRPGEARIIVNGEPQHEIDAEAAGANLEEMVAVVADRLGAAGEQLREGDRIITGILAPAHKAAPGDRVRLELDGIGAVELSFSE